MNRFILFCSGGSEPELLLNAEGYFETLQALIDRLRKAHALSHPAPGRLPYWADHITEIEQLVDHASESDIVEADYLEVIDTLACSQHTFCVSDHETFEDLYTALKDTIATAEVGIPKPIGRYMLFGLPRYDGRGGMEDFLHSFDSVKDCVDALRAFVNGSEDELSETWHNLRQANTVYLLDRVLDREQSVRWSEYGAERNIFPDYQDLLQFETKSKPRNPPDVIQPCGVS